MRTISLPFAATRCRYHGAAAFYEATTLMTAAAGRDWKGVRRVTTHASILDDILDNQLCTGCGLCVGVDSTDSLTMGRDAKGYLRPKQTGPLSPCVTEVLETACPALNVAHEPSKTVPQSDLWGPIVSLAAVSSTQPSLQFKGASGGGLSGALHFLIESGRVDGVLVNKASQDRAIDNQSFSALTLADIETAAGSRYAPSAPLAGLSDLLEKPGRFAFVGKPCDVAALRAYEAQNPSVAEKIPYKLSFFCAGVPSQVGAQAILKDLGVDEADVAEFRYRGEGWPGYATATLHSGEKRKMSYHDSWGGILSKHLQHRCKICADGIGTFADIVFADAWECDDAGYPLFEEQEGRSAVIARTEIGQSLLDDALTAGQLAPQGSLTPQMLEQMQPYQSRRKGIALARIYALRLFGRKAPRYLNLGLAASARRNGPATFLRNFLGMCRRVLNGRV